MFSVAPHIVWSDVDGELVLFDRNDARYFGLNTSASAIWRGLAKGDSIAALIDALAAAHAIARAEIADEVQAFADDAVAQGLLLPIDSPA